MSLALSPAEWEALALSLQVATCSLLLTFVPGIACGWFLARKSFPGKVLVEALVHAPLVLPPVVMGYALLFSLGRHGFISEALFEGDLRLAFTWRAAALASTVMGFPLMVRAVRLAIELVDLRLEQAATTLGATPWRVFWTVTLPLSLPGVVTGSLLAFARSLGEFGATITFAGNLPGETRTLPLALFTALQSPGGEEPAMRLAVLSIVISLAALVASELIARRIARRLGRDA